MEEQSNFQIRCFQVIAELTRSNLRKLPTGLDLEYPAVIDNHVQPLPCDCFSSELNGNRKLSGYGVPALLENVGESRRIDAFKKPIPKFIVTLEKHTDDFVCNFLVENSTLSANHVPVFVAFAESASPFHPAWNHARAFASELRACGAPRIHDGLCNRSTPVSPDSPRANELPRNIPLRRRHRISGLPAKRRRSV